MTRSELEGVCGIKCSGQMISRLMKFGYIGIENNSTGTTFKIIEGQDAKREARHSLGSYCIEYVGYLHKTHSEKYAKDAARTFGKLQHFTGDIALNELTPIMLETFFADSFKGAQFETAKNYRTLKAAFNHAVSWNYLHDSSIRKVKLPKLTKSIPAFLSEHELQSVLDHTSNCDMRDLFTLAFHTGFRLSELLNLEWQAVNLSESTVRVSNSETFTTKSKKERIVPLNGVALNMLSERRPKVFNLETRNYVFAKTPGEQYKSDSVSKLFKKAVRAAGLNERLHFHSLRHSTASNMVRAGVPLAVVKEILGHSDITTTMIYSHVQNEDKIKAVKALESVP